MKVLVIHASSYTCNEMVATALAEGAAHVPRTDVQVVPVESVSRETLCGAGAVVLGSSAALGNLILPMAEFLERLREWEAGSILLNRVGGVFATGSGERVPQVLQTLQHHLLIYGMVPVGLWPAASDRSPCGFSLARPVTAVEAFIPEESDLARARAYGTRIAEVAWLIEAGTGSMLRHHK